MQKDTMQKDTLAAQMALQLKKQRTKQGLSLDKLSAKCGVSKAMLGQIERRESSPTIATLWKIATALNCSFSSFITTTGPVSEEPFSTAVNEAYSGIKSDHSTFVNDPNMKVKTLFSFSPVTGFEMFEVTLCEYHQQLSAAHQSGVIECIHVTSGTLGILIDDTWQEVQAGEQFQLKADQPHGYKAISQTAVFIVVIHYPVT